MNIQFHLTNLCNLRCKHCYQGEYNPEMISLSDFKAILDKTRDFFGSIGDPLHSIALTGGEPLCVPHFEDYLFCADSYVKSLIVMSNGLLLTPERLACFKQASHFRAVQVSLEGPKPINDMIRGEGTYEKIRKAIRYINDAGLRSTVSCTIAPYNYNRIEELYDDLIKYDSPHRLWFDRCIPYKDIDVLTPVQFKVFIDTLRKLKKRWKEDNLPTFPAAIRALQWLAKDEPCEHYICGAGMRHFCILYNGDVMICRRLNFAVGNLLKEDWDAILKRAVPTLRVIHSLPDDCKNCFHAKRCNGGLKCLTHAVYGDFNHKDINCYLES